MPYKKGFLSRAPFKVSYSQQVAAATMLTTNGLFCNPSALGEHYDLIGIDWSMDVASSSGTFDVRKVPASTAFTGGTSLLTGTISIASGARTATKVTTLATSAETRRIRPGDSISLIFAGTLTSLVGFSLTIWLQAMRGIRAR